MFPKLYQGFASTIFFKSLNNPGKVGFSSLVLQMKAQAEKLIIR